MVRTLLVEKLVEREELQSLYDCLPAGEEPECLERLIADCERILLYLMDRFSNLNHQYSNLDKTIPAAPGRAGDEQTNSELRAMEDTALLRCGSVLKYICTVEAGLQDVPVDESVAKLRLAQAEWRRRFGNSVVRESF
jgi:hypothetical protein